MRRWTCAWTRLFPVTAAQLVNEEDERELARIFREFGEERHARRIARAIVARRADRPFARTADLVDTVKQAVPAPARFGSRNPARRVFQALRIAVNDELESLKTGAARGPAHLGAGRGAGRHQLPLARRPDSQGLLHVRRAPVHVSARVSRVRLRQDSDLRS